MFKILDPANEILYEKTGVNSGMFHFHVTEPGIYSFIFNNE